MTENCYNYYIMNFPFYGKSVFYGTEAEAKEFFLRRGSWEGGGDYHKADKGNKEDSDMVVSEIINVRLDIMSGVPLEELPREDWF
ncbi:MAG: hypothetical protein KGL39_41100 [Patescibacteria group bacterium]|nr:hypothetical protein [Patescibacteria group bacterium]